MKSDNLTFGSIVYSNYTYAIRNEIAKRERELIANIMAIKIEDIAKLLIEKYGENALIAIEYRTNEFIHKPSENNIRYVNLPSYYASKDWEIKKNQIMNEYRELKHKAYLEALKSVAAYPVIINL